MYLKILCQLIVFPNANGVCFIVLQPLFCCNMLDNDNCNVETGRCVQLNKEKIKKLSLKWFLKTKTSLPE